MGFLWNAPDGNSYLSRMEAGRRGEWLMHLNFTAEEHPGVLLYPHYYLLGKLAGLVGLPNVFVFHLARLAAGGLLLWASWRFICRYFTASTRRRTAFLLVCLGSGLGWLAWPLGLKDSTDLWVAESQTFFSILAQPHYPLATVLLIFSLLWLQDAFEATDRRMARFSFLKAAAGGFGLGIVHPFLVITLGVVGGLYLLRLQIAARQFEWSKWLGLVAVGLVALPMPLYTFLVTAGDPVYAEWMRQNQILSPLPFYYLLGYGFLALFAAVGGWWAERLAPPEERGRWQLVTTWVVATAVLLYVPLSFQRRFVEGLHLPVVLLATAGFYYLTRQWRPGRQRRRAGQFVLLTSLSTFLVLGIFVGNIFSRGPNGDVHPLFLNGEEVTALNWLRANTARTDTVMTGPLLGNYIPAWAGNRVFYGHDLETIRRDQKIGQVERFYQFKMSRQEMTDFIGQNGIRYVYFGPEESAIFATRDGPATANPPDEDINDELAGLNLQDLGWSPAFVNSRVQIYRTTVK